MTFNEAVSTYIFSDGQIISCTLNYGSENNVVINLKARKQIDNKIKDCFLELNFKQILEFSLFEDFTSENYSDITFTELEFGEYYLSLDPYVNSNKKNDKDNFIVKAKFVEIKELDFSL